MLESLLSPPFMPHGHCYFWEPGLLWLQVLSNALIGLSYLAISITLLVLVRRGRYVPFKGMAMAFGAFIVTCGLTHFFDVLVIWEPVYWIDGSVRAVTAVASVLTAILLPPLVPKAVALARASRAARERGIELEAAVDDLEQMYEKTRELEQLKTEFFANVSHELRTPLALILGPAERSLDREGLDPKLREDLELIRRNARTLLGHVDDLLDIARLEAGKTEPNYARVDVSKLVRTAASHFDGLARERDIDFVLESEDQSKDQSESEGESEGESESESDTPASLMADVDADKIERVVLNLLGNAFKFTPRGGRIRCTLALDHRDDPRGGEIRIDVADSGPGVPEDDRETIFERFTQADGSSTREHGGTGLGLAISRDFVALHGGSLHVEDAPEGGALFRAVLPRRAPEGVDVAEAPVKPEAAERLTAASELALRDVEARLDALDDAVCGESAAAAPEVLVVEDNAEMNTFVCETLGDDYRVVAAFDGREGLEKALEGAPDLIVSDVMMPVMSGDEMLREIRSHDTLDTVPVLVLTAKADDELRVEMLEHGAQDYVMKPFSPQELRARVRNLLVMKRARDVLQRELDARIDKLDVLASEVADRKRELALSVENVEVARKQAEAASQLKSNFMSLVSHELRTPLAALKLQIARLEREHGEAFAAADGDDGKRPTRRMRRSLNRMQELVESLLQHARVEAGRLQIDVSEFDLVALAHSVATDLRPQARDAGLALGVEPDADALESTEAALAPLRSDPQLVRIVLVNLVGNAIKFTEEGRIDIRVRRADAPETYEIEVQDTGPGIPDDEQSQIFEPFEHGAEVSRKHVPGAGLGLAIVKQLVSGLGGEVALHSKPGEGSTFIVTLPPLQEEQEETE